MTPEGSGRDREIVNARVIVTCPGRNFVTLRVETRAGTVGLGDATGLAHGGDVVDVDVQPGRAHAARILRIRRSAPYALRAMRIIGGALRGRRDDGAR